MKSIVAFVRSLVDDKSQPPIPYRGLSSAISNGASLAPQEIRILLAVLPVTKCQ